MKACHNENTESYLRNNLQRLSFLLLQLFLLSCPLTITKTLAQTAEKDTLSTLDLKKKSLEELMEIDITSVSKRPEPLFETAAAISVITQEDIRRSGARTLPGVLRLAPNLQVAQIDSRQWAISARGFNNTAANKLLVLIDGRSVYTPLYSGVFWDVQNVFLDDVERVEVVSGPGGTLWGANAVNGIINVITKKATDQSSQGVLAHGEFGTDRQLFGGLRYGGKIGESGGARGYFMGIRRGDSRTPQGNSSSDGWGFVQGGMRADWDMGDLQQATIQQDFYSGSFEQPETDDIAVSGGNLVSRWVRKLSEHSEIQLQAYFDKTHRKIPGTFGEDLETYDVDFQHRLSLLENRNFTWGIGFRYSNDNVENTPALAFFPSHLGTRLYNGFFQDEIMLIPIQLRMTIGSKFEHNDFSGFEFQPSVRFSWLINESQTLWWAVSRAVRTPSRIDRDFYVPAAPPYLLAGGPNFRSEKLIAYEIGYRLHQANSFSLDVATFYNVYDDLRSLAPGPPLILKNGLEGNTYGVEVQFNYEATRWWHWRTGYAYLQKDIRVKMGNQDVNNGQGEGIDPKHRLSLRSLMDLPGNTELNCWLRAVDELPNSNAQVPGYVTLDVELGWQPLQELTISVVGKNLLHDQHPEFGAPSTRKEIQRGAYMKVQWAY